MEEDSVMATLEKLNKSLASGQTQRGQSHVSGLGIPAG